LTVQARASRQRRGIAFDVALLAGRLRSVLADRAARLAVAATLLANLATYAYVWSAIETLPELMPLHYNGAGVVDLIGRPAELVRLPAIGTLLLVGNGVLALALHRAERPAAHILLWTALAAQLVIGSGAWILVTKAAGE
jgi:hypothetical protein